MESTDCQALSASSINACCAIRVEIVHNSVVCCAVYLQGIKEHPWYVKELPLFLQMALDKMAHEQVQRRSHDEPGQKDVGVLYSTA